VPPPPASASDLTGVDRGDGSVALTWTHPGPPPVAFDVHASRDPLRVLGTVVLTDVATTSGVASGFDDGGDTYFAVVARRGTELALPSPTLLVRVTPALAPVVPTPGAQGGPPAGLAFPFGIDATGGVRAQSGDALLRGKVLQLLLAAPGERVNLPEYGTRLRDLVFDPGDDILAAATEFAIVRALRRWLGDELQVESVRVASDEAELSADVTYLRTADLTMERVRVGIPIPR
jgi:phage baseplate assembly protein W